MVKILSIFVVLVGLINGVTFASNEEVPGLFGDDKIGNISIGMPEGEVEKALGSPSKRGKEKLWGMDGAYHQTLEYKKSGISLGMVSEHKNDKKRVESIRIKSPCSLATKRGIRIGSTREEVIDAYQDIWNREDSETFGGFIAGSIYGGLMFRFTDGRVSEMFFGAAAE